MKVLNVLVACEESQRVCIEFRKLGHNAFSCDIEPCSGGYLQWHKQGDVLPLLGGNVSFRTQDGELHNILGQWDLIIAFPPCTYLTNAGTRHFSEKCSTPEKIAKRKALREEAAEFFMTLANSNCRHIAIENPVGYMNSTYRKADQIIHPYYFADGENDTENYHQKRTCLWLKNLPLLKRTNELEKPKPLYYCKGDKCKGKPIGWCEGIRDTSGGQKGRAKARSKTFKGVAKAIATQYSEYLTKEVQND